MANTVLCALLREGLKGEARRQFFLSGGFVHNAPRDADTLR